MDFLFTGSGLGATAAALAVGGAVALVLTHGQETHDAEACSHRDLKSHAVRISAGRAFASVTTKLRLGFREWLAKPNGTPSDKAVVIIHGLGEHISRYDHVARTLVRACSADVFGFDHQGHGTSEGVRAHFTRAADLVEDAKGFLQFLRQTGRITAGQKLVVLGHSMGGLIAGCLCKAIIAGEVDGVVTQPTTAGAATSEDEDPTVFSGLVLSSPFLKVPAASDGPVLRTAAQALSSALPRLPVVALDVSSLAADLSVREQYLADPLVYHGPVRARVAQQLTDLAEDFMATAGTMELPNLHVLFGSEDRIVDPEGCRIFARTVSVAETGCASCTEVRGGLHELLNDTGAAPLIEEVCAFVNKATA